MFPSAPAPTDGFLRRFHHHNGYDWKRREERGERAEKGVITWRLSEILRLLQLNLFERRPLRELLGSGNESPPDRSSQLTMKFTWT